MWLFVLLFSLARSLALGEKLTSESQRKIRKMLFISQFAVRFSSGRKLKEEKTCACLFGVDEMIFEWKENQKKIYEEEEEKFSLSLFFLAEFYNFSV